MSEETWTVAVYGATGALGEEIRAGLEGVDVGLERLLPVAGVRSAGTTVPWRGAQVAVVGPGEVDPSAVDVAVLAAPRDVAAQAIPGLRDRGALVVDLTGARRVSGEPLPVLWPKLADADLESHPGGFALPAGAASTAAPVVAALATLGRLSEVSAVELVGATDAGRGGAEALSAQTVAMLSYKPVEAGPFRDVLAFNTLEEPAEAAEARQARFTDELRSLLPAVDARYRLTTVRVPVFSNTTVTVEARFGAAAPDVEAVTAALAAGVGLDLRPAGAALRDASDNDDVLVCAVRADDGGVVRMVLHADPLHRLGEATAALLERVVSEDLW
ncbi:MAG: hypothetical protein CSA66_02945 [Proteobacteria bacterium]|nr:MAG: hypothetical protein CSA66_02945 [Pseudomonadota bacterium]